MFYGSLTALEADQKPLSRTTTCKPFHGWHAYIFIGSA